MINFWTGLLPVLLILALSGLFVIAGLTIYRYGIIGYKEHPWSLRLGLGYFFGLAVFLIVYRLVTAWLQQANTAAKIGLIVCAILALLELVRWRSKYFIFFVKQHYWQIMLSVFLISGISVLLFCLWLPNCPLPTDPFIHFGSIHSGRNVNIAKYIYDNNTIPALTQNYGHALLASIVLWFGFQTPFSALFIWLVVSMCFYAFIVYGFFRWFDLNMRLSYLGLLIVLVGNTALSFLDIGVIDSYSPLIRTGYVDTILAIATFFGFVLWLKNMYSQTTILQYVLVPSIFGFVWNMFASQNIVMGIVTYGIMLIVILRNKKISFYRISISALFFTMAVGLGSMYGGMLTIKQFQDVVHVPGILTAPLAKNIVNITPELPYLYYGSEYHYSPYHFTVPLNNFFHYQLNNDDVWKIENNIWLALRITFWPLVGCILTGILLYFQKTKKTSIDWNTNVVSKIKHFLSITLIVFITGVSIAFWFQLGDFKWELTRFIIPAYVFGMFLLVVSGSTILGRLKQKRQQIFFSVIITFVILIGPTRHILEIVYRNIWLDTLGGIETRMDLFFHH
ncbi:MAG: hypothetical protein WCW27_01625 [Patescibacteria group bacterium]|jgi:hypothetical protein